MKAVLSDYEYETDIDEATPRQIFADTLEELAFYENDELVKRTKAEEPKKIDEAVAFAGANIMYNVLRVGIKKAKEAGVKELTITSDLFPEGS
jgi:hypothetical protein